MANLTKIIFIVFSIILFITITALGLFSIWLFIGILMLGLIYLFGYLYVYNFFKQQQEIDREEKQNKKKLDWCWNRANNILQRMAGGQALGWDKGRGRRTEYKELHDGVQSRGFRSMEGYLQGTQQLVVIIFDIENDDIARYYADPNPDVIMDHFANFKPFQQKESFSGMGMNRYPYQQKNYVNQGMPLTFGDPNQQSFDNMPGRPKPSEDLVNDALKKVDK